MIRTPIFWEKEAKAPILNLNYNFVSIDNAESIIERAQNWLNFLHIKEEFQIDIVSNVTVDEETNPIHRILRHDVERTFLYPPHRQILFDVLNTLYIYNEDYAQGMSYVTSYLLLLFEPEIALRIVKHLSSDPDYFKDYWKSEAIPCAIDCYLSSTLLIGKFDDNQISNHLLSCGVIPNGFAQKWFSGLCLHVLPFDSLFNFFERTMEEGFRFVFKFAISLFLELKDDILHCKDISKLFGYLRLDKTYFKNRDVVDIAKRIIEGADRQEITDLFPSFDFDSLRKITYDKYLKLSIDQSRASNHHSGSESESDCDSDYSDSDSEDDQPQNKLTQ